MIIKSVIGAICYSILTLIMFLQLVRAQDIISTIAGGGSDNGEGVAATSAALGYLSDVALDSSGMDTVLFHFFLIFCALTDRLFSSFIT